MAPLKSYIERIENLLDQKKDLNEDIKSVYNEADADGLDKKVMRQVIRLRKMNPQDREILDQTIESYMSELERANV